MSNTIRGISRDEKVDIARSLLTTSIASHDLDPELGIDLERFFSDDLVYLLAFLSRYPGDEVLVQVHADLPSADGECPYTYELVRG